MDISTTTTAIGYMQQICRKFAEVNQNEFNKDTISTKLTEIYFILILEIDILCHLNVLHILFVY